MTSTKQRITHEPLRAAGVRAALEQAGQDAQALDWIVWDTSLRGFGLRLRRRTPGGRLSAAWFVRARAPAGESVRYTLARHDRLTLEQARRWGRQALADIQQGITPTAERKRQAAARAAQVAQNTTLMQAVWAYAGLPAAPSHKAMVGILDDPPPLDAANRGRDKDRRLAARWLLEASESRAVLMQGLRALTHAALVAITPPDVDRAFAPLFASHEAAAGPARSVASSLKLFRHLRAAWNLCPVPGKPARNPFIDWRQQHKLPRVEPRQGALLLSSDDNQRREAARRWLTALLDHREQAAWRDSADHLLLCLLWGTRARETCWLRWTDVQKSPPHVIFRVTKTQRITIRPLLPWARQVLDARRAITGARGWVFASPQGHDRPMKPRRDLLDALAEAARIRITPHDLRRTVAAGVQDQGLDLQAAGLALGHAGAEDTTTGYLSAHARLTILRGVYGAWESTLRRFLDLPALEPEAAGLQPALTDQQRRILVSVRDTLAAVGLDPAVLRTAKI